MESLLQKRKILVVDDQSLIREGLKGIINRQKDLACCGTAEGVATGEKAVDTLKPDLVVLDILLPDGCGLVMTKELTSHNLSPRILIVSQCDEALYAERALKAGARGYVMKNRSFSEILTAIRVVLAGEFYVSPKIATIALDQMANGKSAGNNQEGPAHLTNRELQIFQLLGAGVRTKDISTKLHLSIKTVETHRENIKHKLKLPTVGELIHYAAKWVDGQGSVHHLESETPKVNISEFPGS
jgi:DNA-binding NarL/FixJ family response regulator